MKCEDMYCLMRTPDGESKDSDEQMYQTLSRQENEKSISSEASSASQATVRMASMENTQANMDNLYARVDMNKKKKRNSDESLSHTQDTMSRCYSD